MRGRRRSDLLGLGVVRGARAREGEGMGRVELIRLGHMRGMSGRTGECGCGCKLAYGQRLQGRVEGQG